MSPDPDGVELIDRFKPRYFVVWTARYGDPPLRKVHAAFDDPGPAARYLEALAAKDRPDFSVVDLAGREIERIAHRPHSDGTGYSQASALLPGAKIVKAGVDAAEAAGWRFTDARGRYQRPVIDDSAAR